LRGSEKRELRGISGRERDEVWSCILREYSPNIWTWEGWGVKLHTVRVLTKYLDVRGMRCEAAYCASSHQIFGRERDEVWSCILCEYSPNIWTREGWGVKLHTVRVLTKYYDDQIKEGICDGQGMQCAWEGEKCLQNVCLKAYRKETTRKAWV
jgi:hypothetical protein